MPTEEENCHLVTVTEEEIKNCIRVIPRLDTLILVKAMGHRKSFGNPFRSNSTTTSTTAAMINKSKNFKMDAKNISNIIYAFNNTQKTTNCGFDTNNTFNKLKQNILTNSEISLNNLAEKKM